MKAPVKFLELRGNDPTGHGYYGAKRGTRKHKGVDVLSTAGEDVMSPINGVITKFGWVYKNHKAGKAKMRYVEITGDTYRMWIMYTDLSAMKIGDRIFEGDVFGKAQDVSEYWGGSMRNHLHIQLWKNGLLTDPEPLLT